MHCVGPQHDVRCLPNLLVPEADVTSLIIVSSSSRTEKYEHKVETSLLMCPVSKSNQQQINVKV